MRLPVKMTLCCSGEREHGRPAVRYGAPVAPRVRRGVARGRRHAVAGAGPAARDGVRVDATVGARRAPAHRRPVGHRGGGCARGPRPGRARPRSRRPPGHAGQADRGGPRRAGRGRPGAARAVRTVPGGAVGARPAVPRPDREDAVGPVTRFGLTGGVASCNSTVSAILAQLGAVVIDADLLAREVVAPGTEGLAAVVEEFGPDVLGPDGGLDRPRLGALVFADLDRRRALEAIIHPRVRARAAEIEAAAPVGAVVVHDIPLLAETGQAASFEAVVVVDVPVEVQVDRMVRVRGMSEADARARIAAQADRDARLAVATYVVENTGDLDELRARVEEV